MSCCRKDLLTSTLLFPALVFPVLGGGEGGVASGVSDAAVALPACADTKRGAR